MKTLYTYYLFRVRSIDDVGVIEDIQFMEVGDLFNRHHSKSNASDNNGSPIDSAANMLASDDNIYLSQSGTSSIRLSFQFIGLRQSRYPRLSRPDFPS